MESTVWTEFEKINQFLEEGSGRSEPWKKNGDLSRLVEENQARQKAMDRKIAIVKSLYQDKYGVPPEPIYEKLCDADVAEAQACMAEEERRPFVLNEIPRLFARKPKESDYMRVLNNARILSWYYRDLCCQQTQYLDLVQGAKGVVCAYAQSVNQAKANLTGWDEYKGSNSNSSVSALYCGDILQPLEEEGEQTAYSKEIVRLLGEKSLLDNTKQWIRIPFTYQSNESFTLFVDYSFSEDVAVQMTNPFTPAEFIHNLMYQIIHSMPQYAYQFVYVDQIGAGKTLNEFQTLRAAVDGNAYWLSDELFHNTFRLFETVETTEAVHTRLSQMDQYVGKVNRIRNGVSLAEYNQKWLEPDGTLKKDGEIIPRQFILFENTHQLFNETTCTSLLTLIQNARACGLSILMISQHPDREALDEFECRLKSGQNVDILEWSASRTGNEAMFSPCGRTLRKQDNARYCYNLQMWEQKLCESDYLEKVRQAFTPNLKVETTFEKVIDWESEWGGYRADDCIELPIGVNSRGQLVRMTFGDSEHAHAILAGGTGCGKSTFLHSLINSVIVQYRPDDVQLWLADFKANEFSRYMENTPPHVRFVSSDRSKEFCMELLEKIHAAYEERIRAFGTITSVKEYREKHGAASMPRILVIMDEFHVLSSCIADEPKYKQMLEDILREARAFGITLLLSDQTCGVGLKGLTEAANLNLTGRMAMKTTTEEYNAVFHIGNARDAIPTISPWEIVIQRVERTVSDGKESIKSYYEHLKTLNNSSELREKIAGKSIAAYGETKNPEGETKTPEFVTSDKKTEADWEAIAREEQKDPAPKGIRLYLGTPTGMGSYFQIALRQNYGHNFMCVGQEAERCAEVILSIVQSIQRSGSPYRILVFADENNEMYENCEEQVKRLCRADPRVSVYTEEEEICRQIVAQSEELQRRFRVRRPEENLFLFWIGLEDLSRTFDHYPAKRPPKATVQDELDRLFDDLFSPEDATDTGGENVESGIYNANEDVQALMQDGPKNGIYHFVFLSAVSVIRRANCIKRIAADEFKHKVAFSMSKDDALEYLGQSRLILKPDGHIIDESMAVYSDGRTSGRFVPFRLPEG